MKLNRVVILICFVVLAFSFGSAMAQKESDKQVEVRTIETLDGKKYEGAKVRRVEPSGIVVSHKSGVAKIKFSNLSEVLQKEFGYDPQKAKEHEKKVQIQQAGLRKRMADERRAITERNKQNQASIAGKEALRESAKKEVFYVSQVIGGGALVNPTQSKAIGSRLSSVGGGGSVHVFKMRNRKIVYFIRNAPSGLVDDQKIEYVVVPDGTFAYTTVLGAQKNVKAFRIVTRADLGLN